VGSLENLQPVIRYFQASVWACCRKDTGEEQARQALQEAHPCFAPAREREDARQGWCARPLRDTIERERGTGERGLAPGTPFPSQPPVVVETGSRGGTKEAERYAHL